MWNYINIMLLLFMIITKITIFLTWREKPINKKLDLILYLLLFLCLFGPNNKATLLHPKHKLNSN